MINGVDQAKQMMSGLASTGKAASETTGFDAALAAAQKADQKALARKNDLAAIRDKGFRHWVGEQQIEKIKEELRKKVMQAMGLTEDDLAKMAPAIQQLLERKIQEEIEKQLQDALKEQQAEKQSESAGGADQAQADTKDQSTVLAGTGQKGTDQKDKDGKTCPVIPALAWPGLGPISLF